MKKYSLIGISIITVVILILASLTNVVGCQSVQSSNQKVINDEVNQKELLFQTIVDISNNKEIQRIILKSQMLNGKFLDSDIKLPTTITKQQIKWMYFIGLILSKFISKSRIHSMITQSQLINPEMENEISTIIEKDAILAREFSQLHVLGCNCNEGDSARLWHFPIICILMIPLMFVGFFLLLGGFRWDAYLCEIIGTLIVVSLNKISDILECWGSITEQVPSSFRYFT